MQRRPGRQPVPPSVICWPLPSSARSCTSARGRSRDESKASAREGLWLMLRRSRNEPVNESQPHSPPSELRKENIVERSTARSPQMYRGHRSRTILVWWRSPLLGGMERGSGIVKNTCLKTRSGIVHRRRSHSACNSNMLWSIISE
jgi:hypothetical protein